MKALYEQWRDSAAVVRFHTLRQIKPQTVGAHSHGVAMLVMQIEPECSAKLLKAALTLDFHEQQTGDMPSPAKRLYPPLGEAMDIASEAWDKAHGIQWDLSMVEQRILKFCDYLELLLWELEEAKLGNTYAHIPIINICKWLDALEPPTKQAYALYGVVRLRAVSEVGMLEHYSNEVLT